MVQHALSCHETFLRLNDYVDRELSPAEHDAVVAHLFECANCTSLFEFEANIVADLKAKLSRIQLPPTLKDRVLDAIQRGAEAADV
jgi:anti-sigma factor (TIGR02949 family)